MGGAQSKDPVEFRATLPPGSLWGSRSRADPSVRSPVGDGVVASTLRCCPSGGLRPAISLRSVRLRTFRFAKRCSAQDDTACEFFDTLLGDHKRQVNVSPLGANAGQ